MIVGRLTEKAETAGNRYQLLVMALSSLYDRAVAGIGFGSAAWTGALMNEARDIASTYIVTEMDVIESELREIAEIARTATLDEISSNDTSELTVEALEHLQASGDYLRDELLAQISRDVATLRKNIQKANLDVSLISRSTGQPLRSAAITRNLSNASGIDFVFHDRASRKWSSKTFVRTTWRHTLLSVYNEVVLLTLADHGINHAEVTHEDPQSEHHGEILTIAPDGDYASYSDMREIIFHPNAHAVLKGASNYV